MRVSTVKHPIISIVVPVWNDAGNISNFVLRIKETFKQLSITYEIIFCVDPSYDDTEFVIREITKEHKEVKALFFATRAGQPSSTLAGLRHSKGDAVIVIDVDMQDPIELIPLMIKSWNSGDLLVIPRRTNRFGEPITKRMTAALGYAFLSRFASTPIPKNTGDYRLMDKSVVQKVLALRESHVFLRGLVALVNQSPVFIDFIRPPRKVGRTKYNKWFGGIRSGINGIVSYSHALLDFIMVIGFLLAIVSFGLGTRYVIYKLAGNEVPPGNAQLFAVVTFIGGMQLVALGIIGLYVGRTFDEVKNRPRWIIKDSIRIQFLDRNDKIRTNPPSLGDSVDYK